MSICLFGLYNLYFLGNIQFKPFVVVCCLLFFVYSSGRTHVHVPYPTNPFLFSFGGGFLCVKRSPHTHNQKHIPTLIHSFDLIIHSLFIYLCIAFLFEIREYSIKKRKKKINFMNPTQKKNFIKNKIGYGY